MALLVIPATQMTTFVFKKIGVAGTCVFGNTITAIVTALLLVIGNFPPTDGTFGVFVFVMYAGFPFTVFSQLTTGPMLDAIAPESKIGYVQGLNNSAMNFGMALAPWAFGLLADYAGTNVSIGIAIGMSLLAALVNSPLMWHPLMGRPKPTVPKAKRALEGEDAEMVEKLISGDVIDAELILYINMKRALHGKPAIVPRVKPYDEEKDNLGDIARGAADTFKFRMDINDRALAGLSKPDKDSGNLIFNKQELVKLINISKGNDQPLINQTSSDLGQWMGDYLADNGYSPHTTSMFIKQMFMSSFPPLLKDTNEITEENVEQWLVKSRQLMSRYVEQEEAVTVTKTYASNMQFHASGWW